jgi:hypothetical protein
VKRPFTGIARHIHQDFGILRQDANEEGAMAANATKDELHQLVDLLDDVEVDEAFDYLR